MEQVLHSFLKVSFKWNRSGLLGSIRFFCLPRVSSDPDFEFLLPFPFLTSTLDAILSDLLCQSESPLEIQVVYHIGITLSGYNIASVSDFVNSFLEEIIISFHLFRKLFAECTVPPCPSTRKGPGAPPRGAGARCLRAAPGGVDGGAGDMC